MDPGVKAKLDQFFANAKTVTYSEGDFLILPHMEPRGVTYLLEGVVEKYDVTPEGNRVTVNVFKPGAFIPMSWAINRTENIYFYVAATDVRAKVADREATLDFVRQNADVMLDLLSRVYRGTDALLHRTVLTAGRRASVRFAFGLLTEVYRFGEPLGDGLWRIRASQLQLAGRSGLTREAVSRETAKLLAAGIIARSAEGMTVEAKKLEEYLDANS